MASCSVSNNTDDFAKKEKIIGKWQFEKQIGNTPSIIKMSGNVIFETSGKSTYKVDCFFSLDEKRATYKLLDLNNWRVEDSHLLETTIETNYYDFSGDPDLINIIKEMGSSKSIDGKVKILEISDSKMILSYELEDGKTVKDIFNRIQ